MESKNKTKYDESVLDWNQLNVMGITRKSLQEEGNLKLLLDGKETAPVMIKIVIFREPEEVEVTLQLIKEDDKILLQMTSLQSQTELQG